MSINRLRRTSAPTWLEARCWWLLLALLKKLAGAIFLCNDWWYLFCYHRSPTIVLKQTYNLSHSALMNWELLSGRWETWKKGPESRVPRNFIRKPGNQKESRTKLALWGKSLWTSNSIFSVIYYRQLFRSYFFLLPIRFFSYFDLKWLIGRGSWEVTKKSSCSFDRCYPTSVMLLHCSAFMWERKIVLHVKQKGRYLFTHEIKKMSVFWCSEMCDVYPRCCTYMINMRMGY